MTYPDYQKIKKKIASKNKHTHTEGKMEGENKNST